MNSFAEAVNSPLSLALSPKAGERESLPSADSGYLPLPRLGGALGERRLFTADNKFPTRSPRSRKSCDFARDQTRRSLGKLSVPGPIVVGPNP